jgi:hypothetical protein
LSPGSGIVDSTQVHSSDDPTPVVSINGTLTVESHTPTTRVRAIDVGADEVVESYDLARGASAQDSEAVDGETASGTATPTPAGDKRQRRTRRERRRRSTLARATTVVDRTVAERIVRTVGYRLRDRSGPGRARSGGIRSIVHRATVSDPYPTFRRPFAWARFS